MSRLPQRASNLNIDLLQDELDDEDEMESLEKKEADRRNRKIMNNFSKRKRMSLFATATGAKSLLPQHMRYIAPSLASESIVEVGESMLAAPFIARTKKTMLDIFSFLDESDLLSKASTVCKKWSEWATDAHVNLLLTSIQTNEDGDIDHAPETQISPILERSWEFLHGRFPWACFLAEGGAKKVYKVFNSAVNEEEALSVM